MMPNLHTVDGLTELIKRVNQLVADQLKELLENKHLYQRVSIDPSSIVGELSTRIYKTPGEAFGRDAPRLVNEARFIPAKRELYRSGIGGRSDPAFTLIIEHIKIFCDNCDEREAFAPAIYVDLTEEILKLTHLTPPASQLQLFSLTYECQRCKKSLVSFLVMRWAWHLRLDGRSPMEHIEVPPFIPKPEQSLYRDAVIAVHGGKILAGLFYLRTFIDQFARRLTGKTGKVTGDEIMDAYNSLLPTSLKDQMPSLREWYDKLSDAIHAAREDDELFDQAKTAIEKHFDIRRVFNILETPNQAIRPEPDE